MLLNYNPPYDIYRTVDHVLTGKAAPLAIKWCFPRQVVFGDRLIYIDIWDLLPLVMGPFVKYYTSVPTSQVMVVVSQDRFQSNTIKQFDFL